MKKEKFKKIRGENRLLKSIENWESANLELDLDYLMKTNYDNVKFRVDPWSRLSFTKSEYPEPEGVFRQKVIESLLRIYKSWKNNLKDFNEDYYLKIWIFFPDFRNSSIVCAIKDRIDWYENLFFENDRELEFPWIEFDKESNDELSEFTWENFSEKLIHDDNFVGEEKDYVSKKDYQILKKELEDFLKTNPESEIFKDEYGNNIKYYYQKINEVWVGEIKK